MAFLDAAIGVTLTEADIAFIITFNVRFQTKVIALFVLSIATESAKVVGAIVTLASKIVVPAVVVRVAGSVPAPQITQAHIIFALFVIVTDLILAVSVRCVVDGINSR